MSALNLVSAEDQTTSNSASSTWPLDPASFDPYLDYQDDVQDAFKAIQEEQLAKNTSLHTLVATGDGSDIRESTLDNTQAVGLLSSRGPDYFPPGFELFGISRHRATISTALTSQALPPRGERTEKGRLQISQDAFRLLLSKCKVPSAFITALARPYLVSGTGFRRTGPHSWDYWCLIPLRAVTSCRVQAAAHSKSQAGSNQMDPFHYIHLSGAEADIRGSHVGLFVRHDTETKGTSVIVVNLLDSRLRDIIEEPLVRTRKAVERRFEGGPSSGVVMSPRFVHLIYLSSALRWWNHVLFCFNQQLVMNEKELQQEIAAQTSAFSDKSKDINTSLHIMAAHLHRYKSELHRVEYLLLELQSTKFDKTAAAASTAAGRLRKESNGADFTHYNTTATKKGQDDYEEEDVKSKIEQLLSQLSAITSFSDELERKVQNILALLFNQIQVTNDKTLQAILNAAQADNKLSQDIAFQSHELTRSMKNDSVAMKTIAILTMLFLPTTSFAAIFSMPFFSRVDYLTEPAGLWIWTLLTVIFTAVAFYIFWHVIQRNRKLTT